MEIKIGDEVVLKSGSPSMTVSKIGNFMGKGYGYYCVWFDKKEKKEGFFQPASLRIATSRESKKSKMGSKKF